VQRLWALNDPTLPPGEGNTEGYIVVSMTHNETKFLKWTSSTPRDDGILWVGDLDIDDWTANLSTSLMVSETTLATSLTDNGIVQVTPTGVYLHGGVRRQVSSQERIVQAVVVGSDIALVIYNEAGFWSLACAKIVSRDSGTYLSEGYSVQLPREPSAMNLFID
jgi:hypothetical protein